VTSESSTNVRKGVRKWGMKKKGGEGRGRKERWDPLLNLKTTKKKKMQFPLKEPRKNNTIFRKETNNNHEQLKRGKMFRVLCKKKPSRVRRGGRGSFGPS